MSHYTLYAAPVSLFSGKARAYLRWKGAAFEEVLTSTDVMREIVPQIGWPVIPIMRTKDGKLVQDTADIIAHVEADMAQEDMQEGVAPSVHPQNPLMNFVSALLHLYGDEWLTLPAMHYRWNYNEEWIYGEFGRMAAPDLDAETQYTIGKKRGAMFKGFVPMLGITQDTVPCIERSYEGFLDEFSAHLDSHNFLLGGRPTLADFAFYGPLYAHLYRDPKSGEMMKARAPKVAAWVERLKDGTYGKGEAGQTIAPTLLPLLARHFAEHLPVLIATNTALKIWAKGQESGAVVPRSFGITPYKIQGCQGQIIMRSFSLYRLQDALDIYASLSGADKDGADELLEATGGAALKTLTISARLTRENYKLVLA